MRSRAASSTYTADHVRAYAAMYWHGTKDERIASMMLHEFADILKANELNSTDAAPQPAKEGK